MSQSLSQRWLVRDGRTTCAFFFLAILPSFMGRPFGFCDACPAVPERKPGGAYVWPIYESYDIFKTNLDGNILANLTPNSRVMMQKPLSPDGTKIVFTSMRTGDLELFIMDTDGSNVKQITSELGYDGGAFFSPDGKKLVFRSSRPKTEEEIEKYISLLEQGLVEPTNMELYTVNIDGSNLKQITNLGKANWAPYYHPSGEKIVFSSNPYLKEDFHLIST